MVKRIQPAPKKTASKTRSRDVPPPQDNGLAGFSMDASDQQGAKAMKSMARSAMPMSRSAPVPFEKMDPASAALQHVEQAMASRDVPGLNRPQIATGASEFKSLGAEPLPLTGTTIVKFRQTFHKVPVYGSLVSVELDEHNQCLGINSSLGTPHDVDHIASVAPADAMKVAARESGHPAGSLQQTPRLYYYFDTTHERWTLAYIIEDVPTHEAQRARSTRPDSLLKDFIVDAHSGKLIAALPRTATVSVQTRALDQLKAQRRFTVESDGNGGETMHDATLNVTTYDFGFRDTDKQAAQLPGKLVSLPPKPWHVEAIGAHANGSTVARYLRDVLKRHNIDNKGGEMVSSVNCCDGTEKTKVKNEWQNAYWNGEQMVYGQIAFPKQVFFSVASMLDIVGHEMFHGVIEHTARLEYRTQPGALNESYADIFGVLIANSGKPLKDWTWKIGMGFDGPGKPLRNLKDPTRHDQPKLMKDFITSKPPYDVDNDWGGVHDNSGIHNFAAYKVMTSQDARGRYLFKPDELAAMFYIALSVHLSRTSHFSDSRRGVVQATRSLFRGKKPAQLQARVAAVEAAFDAVGID